MNKKGLLTIGLSIVALAALVVCAIMMNNYFKAKGNGQIIVEISDVSGNVVNSKIITFYEGDTLVTLLEENFDNVVINNGFLMDIDVLKTPDDWSTFISVYVDDEMSMVGLTDISFTDGTKISLIMTVFTL